MVLCWVSFPQRGRVCFEEDETGSLDVLNYSSTHFFSSPTDPSVFPSREQKGEVEQKEEQRSHHTRCLRFGEEDGNEGAERHHLAGAIRARFVLDS